MLKIQRTFDYKLNIIEYFQNFYYLYLCKLCLKLSRNNLQHEEKQISNYTSKMR